MCTWCFLLVDKLVKSSNFEAGMDGWTRAMAREIGSRGCLGRNKKPAWKHVLVRCGGLRGLMCMLMINDGLEDSFFFGRVQTVQVFSRKNKQQNRVAYQLGRWWELWVHRMRIQGKQKKADYRGRKYTPQKQKCLRKWQEKNWLEDDAPFSWQNSYVEGFMFFERG